MYYTIIWDFFVPRENTTAFELAYGPHGAWAELFKRAPGFIALHLLKCEDNPSCDLIIDCWDSVIAFDAFKRNFVTEYQSLDTQLEGLTSAETRVGAFSSPQP